MTGSEGGNIILKNILKTSVRAPKILWWQANEILYKLQKQQRTLETIHPCVTTWARLVRCMRRFPHNMTKKCVGQASRHYQCTMANKDWTIPDEVSYIKILESFNLLEKRGPQPEVADVTTGTFPCYHSAILPSTYSYCYTLSHVL